MVISTNYFSSGLEACAEVKIHTRHRPVKIIELHPRPVPVKNVESNSVPVPAPSHSTPAPSPYFSTPRPLRTRYFINFVRTYFINFIFNIHHHLQ